MGSVYIVAQFLMGIVQIIRGSIMVIHKGKGNDMTVKTISQI